MRKIALLFIAFVLGISVTRAQDTLVWENFNDTFPTPMILDYPLAITGDTIWYNYDQDMLADGSTAGNRPGEWFWISFGSSDSLTQGLGFAANSWTNDFNTPVANWLVSKAIQITDGASAMLSWKAAPTQTPAYCDGYVVLISTTTNDLAEFTDTVFIAAEYDDEGGQYNLYCGDYTPYAFTPAGEFVHGMDGNNIELNPDFDMNAADTTCADSSRNNGLLKSWSYALSAYDDQMIYIAWVHNATDDNLLLLDDILVTENTDPTFSIAPVATMSASVYPNPATEMVNIQFDADKYHHATLMLINSNGQVVYSSPLTESNHQIGLQNVAAGLYIAKIISDEGSMTKKLVVNK
jgi:hypothetical protein